VTEPTLGTRTHSTRIQQTIRRVRCSLGFEGERSGVLQQTR
jgi:hypothetical protein